MLSFVPRFRLIAAIVAFTVVAVTVAVLVLAAVFVPRDDPIADLALIGIAALLVGVEALIAIISTGRILALRRVTRDHPDGLVFLARRQPAVTSDLAEYLAAHGIPADVEDAIADRWLVALVDRRGMSAWTPTPAPVQLVLMPWVEIGTVEVTDLDGSGPRRGIAVPVLPSGDPLVVSAGYAALGLTASVGADAVAEIVAKANALRPEPA